MTGIGMNHPEYGSYIAKYLRPGEYSVAMAARGLKLRPVRIHRLALAWSIGVVKAKQTRWPGRRTPRPFYRMYRVFTEKELYLLWDAHLAKRWRASHNYRLRMLREWAAKRSSGEPMVVPRRSPYLARVERRLQAHRRSVKSPYPSSLSSLIQSTNSGSSPTNAGTRRTTSTRSGRKRKSPSSG